MEASTRSPGSDESSKVNTLAIPNTQTLTDDGTPQDHPSILTQVEPTSTDPQGQAPIRGMQFWLIFVALMMATFLSALDLTSVSVTLPTIIADLEGHEFVWVGGAYTLGSTAFLPLSGGLAQIFGRRPVLLGSLVFFAIGSGICGGATSMTMLIAGRTVQGVGGGGILSLTEIIVADLVSLRERGTFMGIIGAVWAIASAVGPPIGGAFSESNWRWLFYMNLPLTAIAFVLVFSFLNLKTPRDDFRTKMKRMDWIGNLLVIASSSVAVIGLTWGGVKYPWGSYQVLLPLILGLVGLVAFFAYEAFVPVEPVVPWGLVNNRTSLSGYIGTFIHGIVSTGIIFYLPVYFQASKLQMPVSSGVSIFPSAFTIAPGAIACGATVAAYGKYRYQNVAGWTLSAIGIGLMSMLKAESSVGEWVGFQLIEGVGVGILFAATTFPILAALPISETAHALALFTFIRTFSQTWGVAIGSTVLQNELTKRLPADFLAMFPEGSEIAFAAIPQIPKLEGALRTQVQDAFAESVQVIWWVMTGLSGLGLLSVLLMKELKMHEITDDNWGLEEKEKAKRDEEKGDAPLAT